MILGSAISKNKVAIRLTDERWFHITYSHKEIDPKDLKVVLSVVEDPDIILAGDSDELLAVKKRTRRRDWFVVVYKELNSTDGFIITAYLTTNVRWLLKRKIIWSKES